MNWFIRICAYVFFIANYFNFCSDTGDFSTYRGPHIKNNNKNMVPRSKYVSLVEKRARQMFFKRYGQLLYDVEILKHYKKKIGKRNPDSVKPNILNFGIYTYVNATNTFKFFKKENNYGEPYFTLEDNGEDFPMYVYPVFAGGSVVDINFSKYAGMSIIAAYTLYQRNKKDKVIAFENGVTFSLLFKIQNLSFPFNYIFGIGPNILDPLFWVFKICGLVYKVELLAGFRFSIYGRVQPGSLKPDFQNNTFKDFMEYYNKPDKTITDKIFPIINEFLVAERRVYITEHVFYNLNSTMVIPIIISWLQTNCSETWNWIKFNWAQFLLNFTFGVVF